MTVSTAWTGHESPEVKNDYYLVLDYTPATTDMLYDVDFTILTEGVSGTIEEFRVTARDGPPEYPVDWLGYYEKCVTAGTAFEVYTTPAKNCKSTPRNVSETRWSWALDKQDGLNPGAW